MEPVGRVINKKVLQEQKDSFEKLMNTRSFYFLGSEIYGGVGGLYDWGPPGCAIRTNVQQLWREHFILEEDMLEISTTCITPEIVFQKSGHIKKFADLVVRDCVNRRPERADKYLDIWVEGLLAEPEKLDEQKTLRLKQIQQDAEGYTREEMGAVYKELNIKSIDGNDFTEPEPFNLMFKTDIGPSGGQVGYLRPETAQGMFVNFNRLQNFNQGKLPFAAAQIGLGFRNEIAPRQQLIRVREFDMAEIEHFFDPQDPNHPKFKYYADNSLPLVSAKRQMEELAEDPVQVKLGEAVSTGLICNETMAYFLARTYEFLVKAGVNKDNIRFRQHKPKEMAHYACDCWDAEIETSSGWIEAVGHANRTCFDLECHAKGSGIPQLASRKLKEAKKVKFLEINPDMGKIGKEFQRKLQLNIYYEGLSVEERQKLKEELQTVEQKEVEIIQYTEKKDKEGNVVEKKEKKSKQNMDKIILAEIEEQGKYFAEMQAKIRTFFDKEITEEQARTIVKTFETEPVYKLQFENFYVNMTKDWIKKTKEVEKNVVEEKFQPNVIEPAFGLGRIITAILEHNFNVRPEAQEAPKVEEKKDDGKKKKGKKDKEQAGSEQVKPVRAFLTLPPRIAPIKCSILPIMSKDIFQDSIVQLKTLLTRAGISNKVDESGVSLGKRYARTDELGIPFGITVDFETIEDGESKGTITLREIETTKQIRMPIDQVAGNLLLLINGQTTWSDVLSKYPLVEQKEEQE